MLLPPVNPANSHKTHNDDLRYVDKSSDNVTRLGPPKAASVAEFTLAQSVSRSSPRTSAMARTVCGTRYDALGRPRYGAGVRYGASVSTSSRSRRHDDERVAQRLGVLERHRARERQVRAAVEARPGRTSASPEKQCITQRSGAPSLVDDLEHVVVGVAVVDDQGLVEPLGQVDVPPEGLDLRGPPLGPGAVVVEPGLPHRAHLVVGAAPAARSPPARRRASPVAASLGASLGCSATPATRASYVARRLDRPPRTRQVAPDLHDPGHADLASPPRSPRSVRTATRRPAMSRWQWLSTTGCGSGSGNGGRSRSRRPPSSVVPALLRVGSLRHPANLSTALGGVAPVRV